MFAFMMDLSTAELFYRRCADQGADTEDKRTLILLDLIKEGRIENVVETSQTPEEYAKHLAKNFGKVLHVKAEEKPNEI